jgi:hypothetical protein
MASEKPNSIRPDTPMEFLRTELAVGLIYASLAEGQRRLGRQEAADLSLAASERSYSVMRRFLSQRDATMWIGIAEKLEIMIAAENLRGKLKYLRS